jgi:hypothetical protein
MTGLLAIQRDVGAAADSAIGRFLRPRRVVVRDAGLRPALRKRDGRRRGQRKRKCHRKLCYEGRCHGVSPWSGGRRVPLGKLHQRADRKSAVCSPSMPPAPPCVREETHRPDELTRGGVLGKTWSRRRGRQGWRRSREPETRTTGAGYCCGCSVLAFSRSHFS